MSDAIVIALLIFGVITVMRHRGQGPGAQRLREFFGDKSAPDGAPVLPESNRDQVERLEERVRVLERIVTDRKYDLASEIEALRERDVQVDKEPIQ